MCYAFAMMQTALNIKDSCLEKYFSPIQYLKGVGPVLAERLHKLNIFTPFDLVRHAPTDVIYRHGLETLSKSNVGQKITVKLTISDIEQRRQGAPLTIWGALEDGTFLRLVFFSGNWRSLSTQAPIGSVRTVSGTLITYGDMYQINHPDVIAPGDSFNDWCGIEPVYPLTAGFTQRKLRDIIRATLRELPPLTEWIPERFITQNQWPNLKDALQILHYPTSTNLESFQEKAKERLAFDELLADQLILKSLRSKSESRQGKSRPIHGSLIDRFKALLPFALTPCQTKAFEEIAKDMAQPHPMQRLLQGDVGSGKTVIAFMTMLAAIEQGEQAALLAPTGILAQQHGSNFKQWAWGLSLSHILLTGRETKSNKEKIYGQLQSGHIQLVVGTHALIQEDVHFKNLGVVVIDEQHRFGVNQRQTLINKANAPDVLMMTATPIPRTLMLASYGDMACSYLYHKPEGRQEPTTTVLPIKRLPELVASLERLLKAGQKIYWVCPLVEESEKLDLAAAQERFDNLNALYPNQVGLVHGKMKGTEKDKVMASFLGGHIKVLVATTVIEVGVNDPDATVMVIEHAERFGLAQLHQLRGRIGRGKLEAHCILLYAYALSEVGRARLEIMRQTTDGFKIAEEDWRLRGGGDILGERQSGLPPYRFADLTTQGYLLQMAHGLLPAIEQSPLAPTLIELFRPRQDKTQLVI